MKPLLESISNTLNSINENSIFIDNIFEQIKPIQYQYNLNLINQEPYLFEGISNQDFNENDQYYVKKALKLLSENHFLTNETKLNIINETIDDIFLEANRFTELARRGELSDHIINKHGRRYQTRDPNFNGDDPYNVSIDKSKYGKTTVPKVKEKSELDYSDHNARYTKSLNASIAWQKNRDKPNHKYIQKLQNNLNDANEYKKMKGSVAIAKNLGELGRIRTYDKKDKDGNTISSTETDVPIRRTLKHGIKKLKYAESAINKAKQVESKPEVPQTPEAKTNETQQTTQPKISQDTTNVKKSFGQKFLDGITGKTLARKAQRSGGYLKDFRNKLNNTGHYHQKDNIVNKANNIGTKILSKIHQFKRK